MWATTVRRFKSSLDPDDRETVETSRTWECVVHWLGSTSSSLTLIRPALGHLHVFVKFFQANLSPDLDVSYLWGSLVCLLQVSFP